LIVYIKVILHNLEIINNLDEGVTIGFSGGENEMSISPKEQSNPFSTGGGGGNFETRVQAAFSVLMLTGRIAPCLPPWPITKIKLQGRYVGYETDDFIVFVKNLETGAEAKLLAQIKHSLSITSGNDTFREVIQAAWNDFNNPNIFNSGIDAFALITGPLSANDINNTRPLLDWARHSEDEKEFLSKVNLASFSSDAKREKLKAFRTQLKKANRDAEVSDKELWEFLRNFYLIGYDLDSDSSSTLSLLKSLLSQNSSDDDAALWSIIVEHVQSSNQNAGTITIATFSEEIRNSLNTKYSKSWVADVKKLEDHSNYILGGIQSNIGGVHIERSDLLKQLLQMTEESAFVFLTGERGCGKSSLIKQFAEFIINYAPVFCFRTEDFDKGHLDHVFSAIGLTGALSDLEASFALWPKKYLLIESLEKLLELQSTVAFTDLINFLRKQLGWVVIASGRDYAYQPITFNHIQPMRINYSTLLVKEFSDEDIQFLLDNNEALRTLSANQSIKSMLKNPFFAELAYRVAQSGTQFTTSDREMDFRNAVWRNVISKEQVRVGGLPLKRKRTFIDIAVRRAKALVYGVPESEFDPAPLLKLEEDNLIRRDTSSGLVSPLHDIFEDWALEQYIEDNFQINRGNIKLFLNNVGHEPALNRSFRLWLHQKLRIGSNVTQLVMDILNNGEIQQVWKDETISALLLGKQPYDFLNMLNDQLFCNDNHLLKRFCFILRISCKTPNEEALNEISDQGNAYSLFLKPYGSGWDAIIHVLFEQRTRITDTLLPHVLEVLHDWSSLIHIEKDLPSSAREVGLLGLHLLNMLKGIYRENDRVKRLLSVIVKVVPAIHSEFIELLEEDVFSIKNGNRLNYIEGLRDIVLTGFDTAFLCKCDPDIVVRVALHHWLVDDSKKGRNTYLLGRKEVEECFGLHSYRTDLGFFPPSGAKGPFMYLLRYHPRKGLDFIVELLNIAGKKYAESDLDSPGRYSPLPIENNKPSAKQVEILLHDGSSAIQYCSGRLWLGYRGHSVMPYVLQSALMALENWLIEVVKYSASNETLEWIFNHILRSSNSVMTTAILVSVATGFPEKLGKLSIPLIRVPEFYDLDLERRVHERGGQEINWFKAGVNRNPLADYYTEERRNATLQTWRKEDMESLITRLQFTNLRPEILEIIDDLRIKAPNNEAWRFRFYRIDSRGWSTEVDEKNNQIVFKAGTLETDLVETQEKTQEQRAILNRSMSLLIWSEKKYQKEVMDQEYYPQWKDALADAKNLFNILDNGEGHNLVQFHFESIIKAAAVLIRDYSSEMSDEDVSWCINLLVEAIFLNADTEDYSLISDKTNADGTPFAAAVLPIFFDFAEQPKEADFVKKVIVTALTHANASVRTEVANGIREHLWARDTDFAQKCIIGSIEYARVILEERNKKGSYVLWEDINFEGRAEEGLILVWKVQLRDRIASGEISTEIENLSFRSHSSWDMLIPCLMIPNESTDAFHILLMSQMLRSIFEAEALNNKYMYDDEKGIEINYELPFNFAKRFGEYFLSLPEEISDQFIELLHIGCDIAPNFINNVLLHIELFSEKQNNKQLYWHLWDRLSEGVQKIAISFSKEKKSDNRGKLIRGMLHADTPWQKVDFEKHDIDLGGDLILNFVDAAGMNPDVFESMASLIYNFPDIFFESGLRILARHQEEIGGLTLFSRINTAFYLEQSIQRFLLKNREPLTREIHHSCWVLLDAIIETASSGAYYLREHLIRSRRIIE
jgi:energy-coupling factor transporter ATP-binding protein EcfA2